LQEELPRGQVRPGAPQPRGTTGVRLIAAERPAGAIRAPAESDGARRALIQQALKARKQSPRAEVLPVPGACGDGLPNPGEECDDGNASPGDGCSAACLVETGWQCTPAGLDDAVADGSLEGGSPNPDWAETGEQFTPICSESSCGINLSSDGDWFAWFGGIADTNLQRLWQTVIIPTTATELRFQLRVGLCDSAADYLKVQIDGSDVFTNFCTAATGTYQTITIDLTTAAGGPYNDDGSHTVRFEGDLFVVNSGHSNHFVDEIRIPFPPTPPEPSVCTLARDVCLLEKFECGLGGWTLFNSGGLEWGLTDDGYCGSLNWPAGNYTDGAGVAACIDTDAFGPGLVESYLCSPELDFSAAVGLDLDFLYNYQIYEGFSGEDFFDIRVGTAAPTPGNIDTFDILSTRSTNAGVLAGAGASESLSLSAYEGEGSAWICVGYGGNFDWYAQVDDLRVRADSCAGPNLPAETSPPGAVAPLTVEHTAGGPEAATLDLAWECAVGAETYRVISGDLGTLQPSGGVTVGNAAPVVCGVAGLGTTIPEPAGSVFLLVAGENAAGIGPLGTATGGAPRAADATCP